MADNITVTQGAGTTMATDDVGGVQYPRVKLSIGVDGSAADVSSSNPIPTTVTNVVEIANDAGAPITVAGTVTANTGLTQPLTNAELRLTAVPISAASLPLPSGAATAANQTTEITALNGIRTAVELIDNAIAGNEMQVDIITSALPTGASTSALQTTGNSSLSSIDGKLPALSGGRVPVDIGGTGSITVTSGTITVANTVEITNDAGAPVPVSGTVTANTGLTQPLTDTQLRASSVPVSGPLTDTQLRATAVPISASSLPLPTGAATSANQTDGSQKTQLVDAGGDIADIRSLSSQVVSTDKALVSAAVIHGLTTGGGGGYVDVKVNPSGALVTETTLSAIDAAALGQKTMANSLPVVIASNQSAIPISAASLPLPTGSATETTLSSIDTKTPALDNSKQPVVPSMTSGGNISVQTAATGTNWAAFASQALKQLTVSNQTQTSIEFRQGGAGVGFIVPNGTIFTFFGITNANQIEARRVDTSNTQVTVTSRWES